MSDQVTEVIEQSWFGRIKNAFAGILFGLILTVAAFPALTWNEKRAIDMTRTLKEGAKKVVAVVAEKIDVANEGGLVQFSGLADSADKVADALFGIEEAALKLKRVVETYQWNEDEDRDTDKEMGGGSKTTVTYNYRKVWSEELQSSSAFKSPGGHENPAEKRFPAVTDVAKPITLGAFTLPDGLVGKIDQWQGLPVPPVESAPEGAKEAGQYLYYGGDPTNPAVGDTRVKFESILPHEVSVMANQVGGTLEPFTGKSGARIFMLEPGVLSADAMFSQAHSENRVVTWLLRLLFFVMMGVGLSLIFRPLSVIADVVPLVGSIVGAGTGFVAFALAGALSSATIALAWLAFRPLIGVPLLALTVFLFIWVGRRMRQAEPLQAA